MLFSSIQSHMAGVLAMAATMAWASPAPLSILSPRIARPIDELAVRNPLGLAGEPHLEKRLTADFCLEHSWTNHVLFGGSWLSAGEQDAERVALQITCLDCWTKGTVTAHILEDILNPVVRLDFAGVEAYVDLGVSSSAGATYAINLFASDYTGGLGFPGLSIGLVFYIDLVFSISAEIDLTGGFYVKVAEGSFLETNVFTGEITDHFFDGLGTKSIPVTVVSGSATFKADLRLRVQCGASVDGDDMIIPIPGLGAGADVGIYANLVEFVAILDSTPSCALQTREYFDLNVGAYANLDVVVDFKTMGVVPTISTTLVNSPTFTQCWVGNSPQETGPAITATTNAVSGGPPRYSQTQPQAGSATASVVGTVDTVSTAFVATITAPVSGLSASTDAGDLVTSTVVATTVYTITSCAATVVNCPASYQHEIVVTKTMDAFTTVCPASANITLPASQSLGSTATVSPASSAIATVAIVTEVVVLSQCPTPIVETFVPPSASPTPADHTAAAVATPSVVVAEKVYKNATASYSSVMKPSAGGVTSSVSVPSQTPVTASAARSVGGGMLALVLIGLPLVL